MDLHVLPQGVAARSQTVDAGPKCRPASFSAQGERSIPPDGARPARLAGFTASILVSRQSRHFPFVELGSR